MLDNRTQPLPKQMLDLQLEDHLNMDERNGIIDEFLSQLFVIEDTQLKGDKMELSFSFEPNFKATFIRYMTREPLISNDLKSVQDQLQNMTHFNNQMNLNNNFFQNIDLNSYYSTGNKKINNIINYLIRPRQRSELRIDNQILIFLVKSNFIKMEDRINNHNTHSTSQSVTKHGINFVMNSK